MVASLSLVTFALSALSLVSARAVPRQTKPDGYVEGYLEQYSTYKARYLALGCPSKHNTDYFDLCCHPMLDTESLEDKDPSCNPANVSASSSVTEATSTESASVTEPTQSASFTGDDDLEDCDEEDDGDYEDCDDETTDSPQSQAPSSTQAAPPPPTTTAEQAPPETTSSAEQSTPTTTEEQAPPTSTSEEQAPPTSTTEEQTPPTSTTEEQAPPTTTDAAPTTTSEESQPTQSSDNGNNGNDNSGGNQGGDVQTGGFATWFTQNGVAGACGAVHSDNDFIAAIDQDRYGDLGAVSSLCGKQVSITNNKNGKSCTVTIVDACPTCNNGNSIDLSKGAFEAIGDLNDGLLDISWHFV